MKYDQIAEAYVDMISIAQLNENTNPEKNAKILKIFTEIKKRTPELKLFSGFGHCAYGSKLLYDSLRENSIKCDLIVVNGLKQNSTTINMHDSIESIMKDIRISDPIFGEIKQTYDKNKKLPNNAGHAVVLVENTVFDITSEQFDLPNTYQYKKLFDAWKKVRIVDITLDLSNKKEFFIQSIKTIKTLTSPN